MRRCRGPLPAGTGSIASHQRPRWTHQNVGDALTDAYFVVRLLVHIYALALYHSTEKYWERRAIQAAFVRCLR